MVEVVLHEVQTLIAIHADHLLRSLRRCVILDSSECATNRAKFCDVKNQEREKFVPREV